MAAEPNKLLKMMAGGLGLLALVVGIKTFNAHHSAPVPADAGAVANNGMGDGKITQAELSTVGGAAADTPDDKVKTLIAEVKQARREVDEVRERNEKLLKENSDLKSLETRVEEHIQTRFVQKEQEIDQQRQDAERQRQDANQLLGTLQGQLNQLSHGKLGNTGASAGNGAGFAQGGDIPVGLGIDPSAAAATGGAPVVWVDPLDMPAKDLNGKRPPFPTSLDQGFNQLAHGSAQAVSAVKSSVPKPDKPVFTINRDATLVGSVTMTALIGRIPIGGTVSDPYPFKLLVGSDNLAANGITIPGLDSMVVSGSATGDWGLSCVRGNITSATFVFKDGTIRSYPAPERNKNGSGGGGNGGNQQKKSFGYISDTFGTPCVTGERKSNAVQYLSTRVGLAAAQAWAEGEAAAETTQVVSGETGSVINAVTGNSGQYAKNKAISSGIQESANWVKERQAQSFDAIFVRNGTDVAIHIDEEIPIDYEPTGRKVDHHATLSFDTNPYRHALP